MLCQSNSVSATAGQLKKTPNEVTLHLHSKCLQRPVLIWHGASRSRGGSAEPTFLADVNEAQCYTRIVVHADTGWTGCEQGAWIKEVSISLRPSSIITTISKDLEQAVTLHHTKHLPLDHDWSYSLSWHQTIVCVSTAAEKLYPCDINLTQIMIH